MTVTRIERQEYSKKLHSILSDEVEQNIDMSYDDGDLVFRETVAQVAARRHGISIPSWFNFNLITGGLRVNEFSIICGDTGLGKTSWLASLSCELISLGVPIYIASIEIGKCRFMEKMISVVSNMPYDENQTPENREIAERLSKPVLCNSSYLMSNYDSRVKTDVILADILAAHEKRGIQLAIIDNLNFMMELKGGNDQLIAMDRAIHDFVIFCKGIPIHIIMVAHPRKTEGGRLTSAHDIKGSSTAVQEASNVILMNRVDPENIPAKFVGQDTSTVRELTYAKLRFAGRYARSKSYFKILENSDRYNEA